MVLGIAEDFTTNVSLDLDLTSKPISGVFLNSGVHPSVTIENLLAFLPKLKIDTSGYDASKDYTVYSESRNKKDLVIVSDIIYQSIKTPNLNQPITNTDYWLKTNLDSLRIKNLLYDVLDKVYTDLNLTRKLVNNQFIYEVGDKDVTLPNNYAGWVFEPKGSDYVSFRINSISFQKKSITPVNLYVINQGRLIDTLTITPSNGIVEFKDIDYVFTGKGKFTFAIDSTDVVVGGGFIDPLKYDGFVCHTVTGTGTTPEGAKYSYNTSGNGLGFNITAYLDSKDYIENNINEFARFVRATFEYMVFQIYLHNPNNVSNRAERIQSNEEMLIGELKSLKSDTVVSRYKSEMKKATKQLAKTFDTQLEEDTNFEIEITTV